MFTTAYCGKHLSEITKNNAVDLPKSREGLAKKYGNANTFHKE